MFERQAISIQSAIHWLSFAAAPTFALMALLTTTSDGPPPMLCSATMGGSPFTGMVPMYLLMSVFHSAPWLKLISASLHRRKLEQVPYEGL